MYDYKLMEKLITVAKMHNELDQVKERLEARVWWDDGFKALFDMVLKDVEKNETDPHTPIDPHHFNSMQFKDSEAVDGEANKIKVNRYVRSCLRIVTDYMDRKENG